MFCETSKRNLYENVLFNTNKGKEKHFQFYKPANRSTYYLKIVCFRSPWVSLYTL